MRCARGWKGWRFYQAQAAACDAQIGTLLRALNAEAPRHQKVKLVRHNAPQCDNAVPFVPVRWRLGNVSVSSRFPSSHALFTAAKVRPR